MWRPFVCENLASRVCGVLAAKKSAPPAAEHGRWISTNIKLTKGLKKMFERRGGSKSKKIFPGPINVATTLAENSELNPRKKPAYTEGQKRRAHQVGRVLYDNIVQIVNSGELSTQLTAMSVEIVRAKVVPNFSSVNIYWFSSGSQKDDQKVETLLKEHEGLLRQILTSRHVLGTIPRINFVRDDSRARYLRVESLLGKADFGPDFVPTTLDTPVRDIMLDVGVKDSSQTQASKLQAQFDQVSRMNNAETTKQWLSLQPNLNERNLGNVREEGVLSEKSDDVKEVQPSGTAASKHSQPHEILVSSSQPSSMDVEQLSKQFLSNNKEVSSNSFTASNTHTSQPSNSGMNLSGLDANKEPVVKEFRDDLYGVPHSELLNKILIRRQKSRTRPKGISSETRSEEILSPTVKSKDSKLKELLQKKGKTKGRASSQSDYRIVDLTGYGASEDGDEFVLQNEETPDDED